MEGPFFLLPPRFLLGSHRKNVLPSGRRARKGASTMFSVALVSLEQLI